MAGEKCPRSSQSELSSYLLQTQAILISCDKIIVSVSSWVLKEIWLHNFIEHDNIDCIKTASYCCLLLCSHGSRG